MAVTAQMVKELRESTGAGMMDAKKALVETDGDMEAAVDWLRTKGLAKAAKKADRVAAEGLVGVAVSGGRGVTVEVNSETDFVAKNAEFQALVASFTKVALTAADTDALRNADLGGKSVELTLTEAVARIGENMSLRRMASVSGDFVAAYVHNAAADGMGKIGVLVAVNGTDNGIAKLIAQHVAFANPLALDEASVPAEIVAREKAVFIGQAKEEGKSDAGIESWSNKQVEKFLKESTLLGQKFVHDTSKTVAQAAKAAGVEVVGFVRMAVGEGIEKEKEDFAAEVAKMHNKS